MKQTELFNRLNYGVLVVVTALILAIIALNGSLFYRMTNEQAEIIGREQLETVSGRLQGVLKEAEVNLWQAESELEILLQQGASEEEILDFCNRWKQVTGSVNGTNVYAAGDDWFVIPDFEEPEGFDARERVWFQGARKKGVGKLYISAPYLDAVTGDMCFTVSVLLRDRDAVLGMDYTLSSVQESIHEIAGEDGGDALIISGSGQIVGYSDERVVGQLVSEALPQYTNVFQRILSSGEDSMYFSAEIEGTKSTIFYSCTANEWYLISTVSNWNLYRSSYIQLIRNSILNMLLVAGIIVLYLVSYRNRMRVERQLRAEQEAFESLSSELDQPMRRLLELSSYEELQESGNQREHMGLIRESAFALDHMISGLHSFIGAGEAQKEKTQKLSPKPRRELSDRSSHIFLLGILAILLVTMLISILLTSRMMRQDGNDRMQMEVNNYAHELNLWIAEQKSILDMFVSAISSDPGILEDYDAAVQWLDGITRQYSTISVTYMTNPEAEHTVIMNNGWQPDEGWKVEERQWYIDSSTSEKEDGFNISAPYYDEQTGLYCVTLSERVYDRSGEFLGIFGIDFYLDKLTQILNASYSDDGYAFLVDSNGQIINHPNKEYELNAGRSVSVERGGYLEAVYSEDPVMLRDYDGRWKVAMATIDPTSNFSIIGIKNWSVIYGSIVTYDLLFFVLFGICMGIIVLLVSTMIHWQERANELLKESAEAARRAGQAKSDFLAQMSHEIRTPINAVLGLNEMIMRESSETEIQSYAENIQNAGRTLLSLINSILDFSKIEDGKMEILAYNYDTVSLISDLENMIRDRAAKKGLEFIMEISPDLPQTMFGDDVRIRQIITNLLTNAVKYTESGSVTLRIEAREHTEDRCLLHVEVQDTGVGIREEDREKIFQTFQRLDTGKNRTIEGTGLGISIVQRLLNMMGSTLQLDSTYGEGSVFYFDLEQRISSNNPIGDYRERRLGAGNDHRAGEYVYAPATKVLFIDDNETNLLVDRGLLRRSGIRVDTALSGPEGLDLVRQNVYDILFVDHMMPGMDGIETLRALREQNLLTEQTAVIMMTANAITGAREEYLKEGFDDYLSKPVDVDRMEDLLEKYLPQEKIEHRRIEKAEKKKERTEEPEIEESVPGKQISHELGLLYCAGSEEIYRAAAQSWLESDFENRLQAAFDASDWKEYRLCAHTIKSTALNLGARGLSELAKSVEQHLKNSPEGEGVSARRHEALLKLYRETYEELKQDMNP
ncbi:MAG: response regulator [Lachnospiraceae bacterium]|nr:response regulator [Lachnospiraceae bacterium]